MAELILVSMPNYFKLFSITELRSTLFAGCHLQTTWLNKHQINNVWPDLHELISHKNVRIRTANETDRNCA